ncbi:hypothetical protein DFP91_5487 [Pseudorhodoplanes sinuspersici]|uniref:Uncharacterized protein n=1 Tax=Pseudorhodoplanes sinuspersici TaxID=1235591 RepID=A0A1W6ZRV4_9HYPH|nr:hypothetical protein CAK95_14485 [Pseudorhodoplanes sinuspersici]RKE67717.1 hypothetical protein DFP91_5487 [Pseudorhodoplanes sinuspersici]
MMIVATIARHTLSAPSPLEGAGWGGGYIASRSLYPFTPLPTASADALAVDLLRKGGGEERAK